MLTGMTDKDWETAVEVFRAVRSKRGEPGHDDLNFLKALHYFTVHNLTWRALPAEFGNWNSIWSRPRELGRYWVFGPKIWNTGFEKRATVSQKRKLYEQRLS